MPDAAAKAALDAHLKRLTEAVLFASRDPLSEADLAAYLPEGTDITRLLAALVEDYAGRGVHLVPVAGKWMFQTAPDLGVALARVHEETRKPSRAAMETLAIIAYHQPVTRAEIESIRGVATSRGTLDLLLEAGWIKVRGRRKSPGRPVTWGTTDTFLVQFGLASLDDLPNADELRASGFFDAAPAEMHPAHPAAPARRHAEEPGLFGDDADAEPDDEA
jgi:segregation and condensation protein B